MALNDLLIVCAFMSTLRKPLPQAVRSADSDSLMTGSSTCEINNDCVSCTKYLGEWKSGGDKHECVWIPRNQDGDGDDGGCRSKDGSDEFDDDMIMSHPFGAYCPSYNARGGTFSSKYGWIGVLPAWIEALPGNTTFKYALLRHETSNNWAKGLSFNRNAGLNTYMFGNKGKDEPGNIARKTALSALFGGFQRIAKMNKTTQKLLSIDASPVRRALQTVEVTIDRTLLMDINSEFPIRIEAQLRESSIALSGYPGSTMATKNILCGMFPGVLATITMDDIKSGWASSSLPSTTVDAGFKCEDPMQANIASLSKEQVVANKTFDFKVAFSRSKAIHFSPPTSDDQAHLGRDDEGDMRKLFVSQLVALPEKEGTLYFGHGKMSKGVMRKLWEEDNSSRKHHKFSGVLNAVGDKVKHLNFGQSYLLLDIPGKGETWFTIDRMGSLCRSALKYPTPFC